VHSWLRISLTQGPVPEDYPWNGSAATPNGYFLNGETEDYPVTIECPHDPCHETYRDFGDAPEGLAAYSSGIFGHFPTCIFGTPRGTQELECEPALSTPPGETGYVEHVSSPNDQFHFWLGCGGPLLPTLGVDDEADGKVNLGGPAGTSSFCNTGVLVDCVEPPFVGMSFGQDECYGDADAGLASPPELPACDSVSVKFKAYNCEAEREVFLNILCDWNGDGDWNDILLCASIGRCAPEWAVKNVAIILPPGCSNQTSPRFRVGPKPGEGWLRITLTPSPVPDDFPWAGSAGLAGGLFRGGETEDYPAAITPSLVGVGDRPLPQGLSLATVSPNPSRDGITIRFALPRDAEVSLGVFDVAGRRLIDLARGTLPAGEHSRRWSFRDASGAEVPVGLYIVKLEAEGRVLTQRAIRVK